MSNIYRTSKGNYLNMDELRGANETRVASGNMKVNARGDELGAGGHVVRNIAERAREAQKNTKQTKTNASIKPSVTQTDTEINVSEVQETLEPSVTEEIDAEGNITVKKTTRGKNKSESKSTEE